MGGQNKANGTDPIAHYPFQKSTTLDEIYGQLLLNHGVKNLSSVDTDTPVKEILGCFIMDVPLFSVNMLYEVLGCYISRPTLRKYLNRLKKEGAVKSFEMRIKSNRNGTRFYYVTPLGYNSLSDYLPNCISYFNRKGKNPQRDAFHNYGKGCAYLGFVRSPFRFTKFTYEFPLKHDFAAMPVGKKSKGAAQADAVFDYTSGYVEGRIYIEQDNYSEDMDDILNKLNAYFNHGVIDSTEANCGYGPEEWHEDFILYTEFSRKGYEKRSCCFQSRPLLNLIDKMDDIVSVTDLYKMSNRTGSDGKKDISDSDKDSSCPLSSEDRKTLSELSRWTPAIKKKWHKEEMLSFHKSVASYENNEFYYRYVKYVQREHCAGRRNEIIEALIKERKKGDSSPYSVLIRELIGGFSLCICPSNGIDRFLPGFFLYEYPDAMAWLKRVLYPYFGELTGYQRWSSVQNNRLANRNPLGVNNIFHSEKTKQLICVEYLSCNISSALRMYTVDQEFDPKKMEITFIYLVDSVNELPDILDMTLENITAGTDTLNVRSDIINRLYLTINGEYLFTMNKDSETGKYQEIRIEKSDKGDVYVRN